MHHRETAARMGIDPNDPHHRSSPFPPDMYPPYPPHFNLPPGAAGPPAGPCYGPRRRWAREACKTCRLRPHHPHRGSSGRKDRTGADDGIHVSGGRGRGAAKTSGRSKQSRSSQAPPAAREAHIGQVSPLQHIQSLVAAVEVPRRISHHRLPWVHLRSTGMMVDERDHKPLINGTARASVNQQGRRQGETSRLRNQQQQQPVAVAASMGAGNARLYPPAPPSSSSQQIAAGTSPAKP